jgi:hypothetical protein
MLNTPITRHETELLYFNDLKRTYSWLTLTMFVITVQSLLFVDEKMGDMAAWAVSIVFATGSLLSGLLLWRWQLNRHKLYDLVTDMGESMNSEIFNNLTRNVLRPTKILPLMGFSTSMFFVLMASYVTRENNDVTVSISLMVAALLLLALLVVVLTISQYATRKRLANFPPTIEVLSLPEEDESS